MTEHVSLSSQPHFLECYDTVLAVIYPQQEATSEMCTRKAGGGDQLPCSLTGAWREDQDEGSNPLKWLGTWSGGRNTYQTPSRYFLGCTVLVQPSRSWCGRTRRNPTYCSHRQPYMSCCTYLRPPRTKCYKSRRIKDDPSPRHQAFASSSCSCHWCPWLCFTSTVCRDMGRPTFSSKII